LLPRMSDVPNPAAIAAPNARIVLARRDRIAQPHAMRCLTPRPYAVVSGLDRARPRHVVQRLWAPLHIDMATGGVGGLQSQVLVPANPGSGRCLIEAFRVNGEEPDEERWAMMTGVGTDRFSDPMSLIGLADVKPAPEGKRADLLKAHRLGQRVCNIVIASELGARNDSTDFAAAAPFNALLAGTMAAQRWCFHSIQLSEPCVLLGSGPLR